MLDDAKRRASISGRLADGVSVEQARAELAVISRQYRLAHGIEPSGLELIDTTYFTNPARRKSGLPILGLMLGAVLTVLLLACANVGNLLLARAAARRREIAVRLAIGASRRRIVRQLVTESLILAGASAAGGIAISYVLPLYILGWLADPLAVPLEPDTTILAYTAALVIVTCLASGVAPALHATRGSLTEALAGKDRLPGTRLSLGGAPMAVQVAAALVIVLNGMLLVRSVQHLAARDLGFAMDDVMVASFELPPAYDAARVRAFAAQVLNEAPGALGGARIAFASTVPFAPGARPTTMFRLPGGSAVNHEALAIDVSRRYFDLLRVPLVAGRLFDASDSGRDVILINESLARRFFPAGTPLGQTVVAGGPRQIVGIVKDMHTYPGNLDIALPTIYAPIGAHAMPQILIRAAGRAAAPRLAALAADIDPRARIRVVPLSSGFDKVVMRSTVGAGIATLPGALAVMFAAVGFFSVCAHVVQQRTREIGIRMALGARGSHVMALLFAANGRAIALGIAIGLPSAVAGSLAMRGVLYGLSPADPVAYFTASVLLVIAAAAATFIPARRALRVDPMTALRCD